MSLLHAAASHRQNRPGEPHVPVVLPLVEVRINKDESLNVALDHEPYDTGRPLKREGLRDLLTKIATDLASPVKVEIHELDETVFADLITPKPVSPAPALSTPQRPPQRAGSPAFPGEISGNGFLPNEQVCIAVVVAHQIASSDGTMRLRLPSALLAGRSSIVVLLGESSGTVAIGGNAS